MYLLQFEHLETIDLISQNIEKEKIELELWVGFQTFLLMIVLYGGDINFNLYCFIYFMLNKTACCS